MIKPDEPWPRSDSSTKQDSPRPPTVEYVGRRPPPPPPPPPRMQRQTGTDWMPLAIIAFAVLWGVLAGLAMAGAKVF